MLSTLLTVRRSLWYFCKVFVPFGNLWELGVIFGHLKGSNSQGSLSPAILLHPMITLGFLNASGATIFFIPVTAWL